MGTERKPYKAIFNIMVEVHDILPTGECSGNPVKTEKYETYGIKPKQTFAINGEDLDDTLRKVAEALNVFK
jgi:hypothetical protein